jgi:hypothetical protein
MIFIFSIDATKSHGYILIRASLFGDRSRNNSDGDCSRNSSDGDCSRNNSDGDCSRNNSDGDCSRNNSDGDISRVVKITEIILALKTTRILLVFCIAIVWHTSHANTSISLSHPSSPLDLSRLACLFHMSILLEKRSCSFVPYPDPGLGSELPCKIRCYHIILGRGTPPSK